jgi:serine/threonine-protein kinase
MDQQKWSVIKDLFDQARQLPKDQQEVFVQQHSNGDTDIIHQVMEMLDAQQNESYDPSLTDLVSASATDMIMDEAILKPGDMVERFEVIKSIGEGGMGSVFLGTRKQDDFEQLVAIKVIHRKYLTAQSLQRFRRERQILASLNHKNIASFIGGGETEQGQPYIILEYVDGMPITQYCQQHDLSVSQRITLFKQVLEAVMYAHQNLVVHRDIKPNNVLVNTQGEVKLLDFGIAKLVQESTQNPNPDSELTQEFVRVLTPANASPEQVLGSNITTRSDVYGLGALLMYMLTDEAVFDTTASSQQSIESMILELLPVKPSVRCMQSDNQAVQGRAKLLKGDVDTIVMKALQKEPERRYSSTEQLMQDIVRHQQNYPISAKPDSFAYRAKKFVQRNTLSTAFVSIFVIGLLSASAIIFQQSLTIEQERDTALRQAFVAQKTSRFMSDIFRQADPNETDGGVVSVKSIVDKAADNLQALDSDPLIKAQLNTTLGAVYNQLGEYELGSALLDNANEYFAKAKQEMFNPEYISLKYMLGLENGNSLTFEGKYDEAVSLLTELNQSLDSEEGASLNDELKDFYHVELQYGLGTAFSYSGKDDQAAPHYRNSVDASEQIIARAGEFANQLELALADRLFGLGHSLRQIGEFAESKAVIMRGIDLERSMYETPRLSLGHGLNQLASTLLQLGELEQAEVYAKEGLEIRRSILDYGHVEIMASIGILTNIYSKQGQFERSLEMRKEMLDMVEVSVGATHPYYYSVQSAIGQLYMLTGDLDQAKVYLDQSLQGFINLFPNGHRSIATPMVSLGDIALKTGDIDTAVAKLSEAVGILNE